MKKYIKYLFTCFLISSVLPINAHPTENTENTKTIDSLLHAFETLSSLSYTVDKNGNNIDSIKMYTLHTLSGQYFDSNPEKALQYILSALTIANKTGNKKYISTYLRRVGNVYFNLSVFNKATKYYLDALKVAEDANDKTGIANSLNNLGNVYEHMAELFNAKPDYEKALKFHLRSMEIRKKVDSDQMVNTLLNISNVYHGLGQNQKAIDYLLQTLSEYKKRNDPNGVDLARSNLGATYMDMAQKTGRPEYINQAERFFLELYSKYKGREESKQKANILIGMGEIRYLQKRMNEAIIYLTEGVKMAKKKQDNEGLKNGALFLAEAFNATGDYKQALAYHTIFVNTTDTILKEQSNKQLAEMSAQYESEKKDKDIELLTRDEALQAAAVNKQKYIRNAVTVVLGLALLLAFMVYNRYQLKQKLNTTLSNTNNELIQKNTIIEEQKRKIIDSITYAQLIQQSILMDENEIQKFIPELFIFYKPKDIVSGDFYWFAKVEGRMELGERRTGNGEWRMENGEQLPAPDSRLQAPNSQLPTPDSKLIIAAVDCTGHGVPGAFMSMVGNTLLNQIVNEKQITVPSEILRLLNIGIYKALHQGKEDPLSDDGMDIALCTIDYKNNQLEFAGAENPLYIVADNKITTIEADWQAVGGGSPSKKLAPLKRTYTNHVIPIKKGMSIYLFSDGYMDQFGGSEGKKFGIQKFKNLLLSIQHLNMQQQKELIAAAHTDWKGNAQQIDDILIIGICI